jgi:D-sedoheptulose 7-phosphate isomerase
MRIGEYLETLQGLLGRIEATDGEGRCLGIAPLFAAGMNVLETCKKAGGTVFLIGNGGSAAIASHMATDLWKICGVRALAFNDASLLTCIGNDCGIDELFAKPVGMFADAGDVVVAISSSGRSPNILGGVRAARERGCRVITLSGMESDNPLRSLGDLNIYVPCGGYGLVETVHHALCHAMVDALAGG